MKKTFCSLLVPLMLGLGSVAHASDLIAWWNFDTVGDGISVDSQAGNVGILLGGAAYSDPGTGRTGAGTDRGMRFGTGQQRLHVTDASFLNAIGTTNALTLAFWQNIATVRPQTTFFANSASLQRAFSAHTPWVDGTIYWDTAGCCDPNSQRVFINPGATWTETWVHVVLIKDGDTKIIYVDGVEALNGISTAPFPSDFTELFIGNSSNLGETVNGVLDDVAIFSRALTLAEVTSLAGGASPASLVPNNDTDSDGLPDAYEYRFFPGDLTKLSAAGDFDGDGITDGAEFASGGNPSQGDSDGDGLLDGVETNTGVWVSASNTGTNPALPDTDGDGLRDGVETNTGTYTSSTNTGTNPLVADSDGDLFNDGVEVLYGGSNPLNNGSRPLRTGVLDLLAYWPFNDATDPVKAVDAVRGYEGELLVGTDLTPTSYTADAGGKSGQAGDRAIDFGQIGNNFTGVSVADGGFLNLGASQDQIAISFWQNLYAVTDSTAFKGLSPSSSGGSRGASGHATWSNNRFYWDTAGCCDGTQRIDEDKNVNGEVDLVGTWHHIVFQKKGSTKEIWLDGQLLKSGVNTAPLPLDFFSFQIGRNESNENTAGLIDDFAVYADALTPAQINLLFTGTAPNNPTLVPPNTDSDGDGMPDAYESANGLNPNVDDRLGDVDSDGKTNFDEYIAGTVPNNPDSDGDTLKDGAETNTGTWVSTTNTGTNPLKTDSDNDGYTDAVETNTGSYVSPTNTGTNPNLADTDGDGYDDGIEVKYGANPTLATSVPNVYFWWSFNDASRPEFSTDVINGEEVTLMNGAAFSDDSGGRTGKPGDRALNLGTTKESQMAKATEALWLNDATGGDSVAFAFWQYLDSITDSSAFWASSPSSGGGSRGAQGHATWSNNRFYWDTAGCCDPPTRLDEDKDAQGPVELVGQWNHVVYQKNGEAKEIWVNGTLLASSGAAAALPNDFNELTIGAEPSGANNMLGLIDDFVVYGNVLTAEQIGRLAAGESPSDILGAPTSGGLKFTQVSFNAATNQLTLTWTSQPGKTYSLETSQTLVTYPVELNDNIASGGTTTTYVHDITTYPGGAPAALYYRVSEN